MQWCGRSNSVSPICKRGIRLRVGGQDLDADLQVAVIVQEDPVRRGAARPDAQTTPCTTASPDSGDEGAADSPNATFQPSFPGGMGAFSCIITRHA
jgi:hypothetical protein